MSRVNGVGGCFIFSEDPVALAEWYDEAFEIGFEKYGPTAFGFTFAALDVDDPSVRRETVFSIMKAKSKVPSMPDNEDPKDMYGDQPYMVNLRVDDLDATLAHLETLGVESLGRQNEGYGDFSWVRDPDGNRVELWQAKVPFTS